MPNKRNVRIKTPLGPDTLLFEQMTGHDGLSTPFDYKVAVLSANGNIDLASLLGKTATVEITLFQPGSTRYINGYVTSFSYSGTSGAYARYEITLRPWLWLLSLGTNCRIFQNKTAVEIVKQIWRERGFTDVRDALTGSYQPLEYSVQYRESDLNYVSRLLEHEGIYYFFEHEDGKHKLVLADSPSAHVPSSGYESIPYFPPMNEDQRKRDHLSDWTVGMQMRPGAFATTDYDFTRPRADLSAKLNMPAPHSLSGSEVFEYPGSYLTNSEGENRVRVRLEELQADQQVVAASGNALGLTVGALFSLTDYPRDDQNKQYLIVGATYHAATNPQASGGAGEREFQGSYTLVLSSKAYRPPATTTKPKVDGPQTATVVGKTGEEIWTDKYGRVKLQFHWDREGKADENSSCWVRVGQSWAGAKWGGIQLPRIGQEVIVDFLEGDPDRPIVTGRVYNGANMPPYDLPAKQTQSGVKSHSTKGGGPNNSNELRFDDKKGAEEIYVQAERDHRTMVKNDQEVTVVGKTTETYKAGRETVVTKFDDTTVKDGNKNITVDKQFNLMAQVTNLKAKQDVFIQVGSAIIHLDVAGNISIQGTNIKLNSP